MADIDDIATDVFMVWVHAAATNGPSFWHYGELAARLGRSGQGYLVAQALERIGPLCTARGLPNFACMIVSKAKKERGVMMPSDSVIRKMGGAGAVQQAQAEVQRFDWARSGMAKTNSNQGDNDHA